MTNPKEVLEKFRQIGDGSVRFIATRQEINEAVISTVIDLLTSQLEAIPEDDDFAQNHNEIFFQDGINLERQRQRQDLQLAIKEWSELK